MKIQNYILSVAALNVLAGILADIQESPKLIRFNLDIDRYDMKDAINRKISNVWIECPPYMEDWFDQESIRIEIRNGIVSYKDPFDINTNILIRVNEDRSMIVTGLSEQDLYFFYAPSEEDLWEKNKFRLATLASGAAHGWTLGQVPRNNVPNRPHTIQSSNQGQLEWQATKSAIKNLHKHSVVRAPKQQHHQQQQSLYQPPQRGRG